jgi:hypothetical protein
MIPDKVVILSLDSRCEQVDHLAVQVKATFANVPIERFAARLPNRFFIPDSWNHLASYYATGQDHRKIIADAYAEDVNLLMVLEDDTIFSPSFDSQFANAVNDLPAEWLGLWLGGHDREQPERVSESLVRLTNRLDMHGYILNRSGMERASNHLAMDQTSIVDWAMSDLHRITGQFYAPVKDAVAQTVSRQDGGRNKPWWM